jgi:hypothetical protein
MSAGRLAYRPPRLVSAFGEGGDRQLVAMWCDALLEVAEGPERSDGWTLLRDREGLVAVSCAVSMSPRR